MERVEQMEKTIQIQNEIVLQIPVEGGQNRERGRPHINMTKSLWKTRKIIQAFGQPSIQG